MHAYWRKIVLLMVFFWLSVAGSGVAGATSAADRVILVIGDSLSAEYGLKRNSGWVELIQQRLDRDGVEYTMQNSSISGDTTSGGLSRLPAALNTYKPDLVIIELGSNDALRGLSLHTSQENLAKMIELSQENGADVMLLGMRIPTNYGRRYTDQFFAMYAELAEHHDVALIPFFLEDIATDRHYFQDDGMHPNEDAQPLMAERVWKTLGPLLEEPR